MINNKSNNSLNYFENTVFINYIIEYIQVVNRNDKICYA